MLLLTEIAGIVPVTQEIDAAIREKFVLRDCIKGQRLLEAGKIARELYYISIFILGIYYPS